MCFVVCINIVFGSLLEWCFCVLGYWIEVMFLDFMVELFCFLVCDFFEVFVMEVKVLVYLFIFDVEIDFLFLFFVLDWFLIFLYFNFFLILVMCLG